METKRAIPDTGFVTNLPLRGYLYSSLCKSLIGRRPPYNTSRPRVKMTAQTFPKLCATPCSGMGSLHVLYPYSELRRSAIIEHNNSKQVARVVLGESSSESIRDNIETFPTIGDEDVHL